MNAYRKIPEVSNLTLGWNWKHRKPTVKRLLCLEFLTTKKMPGVRQHVFEIYKRGVTLSRWEKLGVEGECQDWICGKKEKPGALLAKQVADD